MKQITTAVLGIIGVIIMAGRQATPLEKRMTYLDYRNELAAWEPFTVEL